MGYIFKYPPSIDPLKIGIARNLSYYRSSHFTDEKIETQVVNDWPPGTEHTHSRAGVRGQRSILYLLPRPPHPVYLQQGCYLLV